MKIKKSQLRIGESMLVMIMFFMLLVIGLVFYAKVQQHIDKRDFEELAAKRAIDTALSIKAMPELSCTFIGAKQFDCIDELKLDAFKGLLDKDYYSNMFYKVGVALVKVFPLEGGQPPSVQPENILFAVDEDLTSKSGIANVIHLPVNIYHPIDDKYSYGYLRVEVFS